MIVTIMNGQDSSKKRDRSICGEDTIKILISILIEADHITFNLILMMIALEIDPVMVGKKSGIPMVDIQLTKGGVTTIKIPLTGLAVKVIEHRREVRHPLGTAGVRMLPGQRVRQRLALLGEPACMVPVEHETDLRSLIRK